MLPEVKKCAERDDIKGLRYIFVDCLDVDPTFEKYKEDYEFCKNIDGFFDRYVELNLLFSGKEQWNMQYWEQLKLDLMKNFSEKRFEHMIRVARVVYADKILRLSEDRTKREREIFIEKRKDEVIPKVFSQSTSFENSVKKKSKAEEQEERFEEQKRKLELENRRIEEQRKVEEAKRQAVLQQYNSKPVVLDDSKKMGGIVLAVVVIVIIVFILMAL